MPPRISNKTPIFMLCILCLLFRFAYFLVEVPTVRMIEHAACQQQLGRAGPDPPDETTCKGHAVQEQVSMIIGWKMSFDAAPGMSFAFLLFIKELPWLTTHPGRGRLP